MFTLHTRAVLSTLAVKTRLPCGLKHTYGEGENKKQIIFLPYVMRMHQDGSLSYSIMEQLLFVLHVRTSYFNMQEKNVRRKKERQLNLIWPVLIWQAFYYSAEEPSVYVRTWVITFIQEMEIFWWWWWREGGREGDGKERSTDITPKKRRAGRSRESNKKESGRMNMLRRWRTTGRMLGWRQEGRTGGYKQEET